MWTPCVNITARSPHALSVRLSLTHALPQYPHFKRSERLYRFDYYDCRKVIWAVYGAVYSGRETLEFYGKNSKKECTKVLSGIILCVANRLIDNLAFHYENPNQP